MEEVKRIYILLTHSTGLKIKDIAEELSLDKYHVADVLFSFENNSYWYQDGSSLWYAKEGAMEVEESKEDPLTIPLSTPKRFNFDRFLQEDISASLRYYILNLSNYRIYSNEDLLELLDRYRNGDLKALELLVKSQQKLVLGISSFYWKDGALLEDLIQEGNMGLLRAIERFDKYQSYSFTNYAKTWILQAVTSSALSLSCLVRLPQNYLNQYRKIQRFKEKYELLKGFPPPTDIIEIGEEIDKERAEFLSQLPDNLKDLVSFEDMDEHESDSDQPDTFLNNRLTRKEVIQAISSLTAMEADVIRLYFGFTDRSPMSLDEIGEKYNLTRERVRQIKERAIRRLSHRNRRSILKDYLC
ncbi:MAG: sigma-70 family RNA polymerase sigma factor [Bacteroidales bacterium]|nr:sigma-70 family RNA polymerase sigma factor [Bacteroidales bacterium]